IFTGSQFGSDVIEESSSGNFLNFFGFGGAVHLDLKHAGTQVVNPSGLTLTLSNPLAFSTVIGSAYSDNIVGNDAPYETLIGGGGSDVLTAGNGEHVYVQGYVTQVVYLDFSQTAVPNDHIYTPAEKAA